MQLSLTGHHVEVTPSHARLRREETRAHLAPFRPRNRRALRPDGREARTQGRSDDACARQAIHADATEEDMYAAIDLLADKLDRSVLKHKEKQSDHHAADAPARRGTAVSRRASMRLMLVSGLSGSGKSVALHMLEDPGFYCVDNIPAALLKPFISHTLRDNEPQYARAAVGLDARNRRRRNRNRSAAHRGTQGERHPVRDRLPARQRRRAAAALHRDAPQASACSHGPRLAQGSHRQGAPAARAHHQRRRSGHRHLAHGRARAARADQPARRTAQRRPAVDAGRVVRLQERHAGRRGLRVRRARPCPNPYWEPALQCAHGP